MLANIANFTLNGNGEAVGVQRIQEKVASGEKYIQYMRDLEASTLPSYRKHDNFLTLFHTPGSSSSEDYAVAAAASSATWDACCRVQIRLRSPYTLSTRPGKSIREIISLYVKE